MTDRDQIFTALLAQQWEKAKGELRATVAILGAQQTENRDLGVRFPFQPLQEAVEGFIKTVESEGLQEFKS